MQLHLEFLADVQPYDLAVRGKGIRWPVSIVKGQVCITLHRSCNTYAYDAEGRMTSAAGVTYTIDGLYLEVIMACSGNVLLRDGSA